MKIESVFEEPDESRLMHDSSIYSAARGDNSSIMMIEPLSRIEEGVPSPGNDSDQANEDDCRYEIEAMYPERQSASKFSLDNPHARFSRDAPRQQQLRETVNRIREINIRYKALSKGFGTQVSAAE
jgi:hypothetical protein